MAGYKATSKTILTIAVGEQSFTTQAALSYLAGDRAQISYAQDSRKFMEGDVTSYNPVTGFMAVNVDFVSGFFSLQPVWGTEAWGSTGGAFDDWIITLTRGVPAGASGAIPATPTIMVRALDSNWDAKRGSGLASFLKDRDAVSQIIATRLRLLEGEWFEDTSIGTPLFQSLLGHSITNQALALILRSRILGTPYVTGIASLQVNYTPGARAFSVAASVTTQFGPVSVSNQ